MTPETIPLHASLIFLLVHDEAQGTGHHQLDQHTLTHLRHLVLRHPLHSAVAFVVVVAEVEVISIIAKAVLVVAAVGILMTATCLSVVTAHLPYLLLHDGREMPETPET